MSAPAPATCVVATAGHVDHGKSTLVRVLTGTDPDRLAEEKRRGLTIDLGFAEMRTAHASVAFVDVPGHVRFIANMLAGVGGLDAALFVVDAVEGWKPQSEEHLRILELVGITRGIVVLTKAAKADADVLELNRLDVAERVAASRLAGAPLLAVDALSGLGLDELRAALDELASSAVDARADEGGRTRLWVDRSFVIGGAGAVVTGTLTGGALRVGDAVEIVARDRPRTARVRGLQSFGRDADAVTPGHRTAVNLTGVSHHDISRGDALVHPHRWHLTRRFDASIETLAGASGAIGRRGALMLYIGSREQTVRLRPFGGPSIAPGERGHARVTLPYALALTPGDRFVLRDTGRGETVGGGEVLDVDPQLPVSRATPDRSVDRVIRERGWVRPDELARLTGEHRAATIGGWVADPDRLTRARAELLARVEAAGALGLDVAALDERARAVAATITDIVLADGRARTAHAAGADDLANHPLLAALAAAPFRPPSPEELGVDPAELSVLVRRGLVVQHDHITFSPGALEQAARLVARLLAQQPDGVTVAEVRAAMGTTRRYALPLLALLDARGITSRNGDRRVAGPRAGQAVGAGDE